MEEYGAFNEIFDSLKASEQIETFIGIIMGYMEDDEAEKDVLHALPIYMQICANRVKAMEDTE